MRLMNIRMRCRKSSMQMLVREMTIGCHRRRFRHQGKVGIVSWIKMLRYGIDFRIESRGLENDLIPGKVWLLEDGG